MSIYGTLFRVSTFGESHGKAVGCIIDGVPPGMKLNEEDIQCQLDRRRPGQSILTTQRKESDLIEILSGVENGFTLGTPVAMMVRNQDQRKHDYANTSFVPRPGHADYTYQIKYGIKASSGGGRASARETIARVAAGAVAEKWLREEFGTSIVCWVSSVGDIEIPAEEANKLEASPPSRQSVDIYGTLEVCENGDFVDMDGKIYSGASGEILDNQNQEEVSSPVSGVVARGSPAGRPTKMAAKMQQVATRCPHPNTAAKIAARIQQLRREEDSTGGIVTCIISGVPVGLGEPSFDKIEGELAKAMLSLPAVKGFEIGSGFKGTKMRGSEHNDAFVAVNTTVKGTPGNGVTDGNDSSQNNIDVPVLLDCKTNSAGGTLGGITSGKNIVFRVAVKPVSSIGLPQETCAFDGSSQKLVVKGRHDPCVLPRTPPVVEGMAALVMADMALRQRARAGKRKLLTLPS